MTPLSPLRVNALNVGEAETKAMPAATFFSLATFCLICFCFADKIYKFIDGFVVFHHSSPLIE